MDPESKKILEETLELARENNKILHKVRGVQKWQAFWSALRILIIIGITAGFFYYLEPYIEKAVVVFNQISGTKQLIDTSSLQDILKNIKP